MRRPEVVAHRGASEEYAEHTLAAYQAAIDHGADSLECDLRLTEDKVLVCVHDRRIDRTSNGAGTVSGRTYEELAAKDFGSWKSQSASERLLTQREARKQERLERVRKRTGEAERSEPDEAHRLLKFERLLELVRDCDRPVGLAIETKHPTRYAGLVEEHAVAALRRFGMLEPLAPRVRAMSFSELAVRRFRRLAPELPTVLLIERSPLRLLADWIPASASAVGPSIELLRSRPELVSRVQAAGRQVFVWTVDHPADVEFCAQAGVDGIITNRPRSVLAQLDAR